VGFSARDVPLADSHPHPVGASFYKRAGAARTALNTGRPGSRLNDMKVCRTALAVMLVAVLGFASVGHAAGRGNQGGSAAGHGGGPAAHGGTNGFHNSPGAFRGSPGAFGGSPGAFHGSPGAFHGSPGAFHDHPGAFHDDRFHGRGFVGVAPFVWAPGYVYAPPVVEAPPVYVPSDGYWYYCQSAGAYYPVAPSCPEPWIPVPAS
jgi:hypothetical protein